MNKIIKVLAACVAVMLSCAAWAKTYTQSAYTNGRQWWYYLDSSGNAIIEHENSGSTYTAAISTSATGTITVPDSLDGYPVVGIGSKAFYNCNKITKVTIQEGVTDIDFAAFYNCHQLAEVNLPSSLKTIGMYAFGYCIGLEDINFTVPGNMENIYAYAFTHCWALESVTIPQTVTTIGAYAFENCKVLDAIAIPAAVTFLGNNAFMDCELLASVELPASLAAADVQTRCFSGCPGDLAITSAATVGGLTWQFRIVNGGAELYYDDDADVPTIPGSTTGPVVIPDTLGGLPVVSIGEEAFDECDIGSVSIPATVTRIGDGAFSECEYLKSVIFRGTPTLASIGEDAFYDCTDLESLTIPASVTTIGDWAFEDCMRIALTVPDTVATIGDGAFKGCDAMADANGFVIVRGVLHHYTDKDDGVTIPEGVTRIGSAAFWSCDIESVAIPASVTSIGSSAFGRCEHLEGIEIPATVTSIGPRAFWGCEAMADKDGFVIVRDVLYWYAGDAETVTIPGGVTEISDLAFNDNDDLETIVIPASVTSIGDSAFYNCDYLAVATIPSGVATIGPAAFTKTPLATVHVGAGDTDRVKNLLVASWHNVSGITFVEDVPAPCVVAFDANGGAVATATRLVTKGAELGILPEPARDGYAFGGWFTAADGGDEVLSTLVVNADATFYAHWTEISAYTWFTTRAEAFAEAKRTGKKVFMICGRDTCGNTMYTKDVSCEDPSVKTKLIAKCVLWYTNCDTQFDENHYYWPSGSFTLPIVCVIDPANDRGFLKRVTGPQAPADILALLADIPYPSPDSPALDPEAIDPLNPGDLPWYKVINASDIWDPIRTTKAETLRGAAYYGGEVVGIVELKVGKLSKNSTTKVSGSVTLFATGKKHTIKSTQVYVGTMASSVSLDVKGLGGMSFALGSIGGVDVFAGALGRWHVQSANVGGAWNKADATVEVAVGDVSAFGGGVFTELLPTNEVAAVANGKWKFAKAATVKYAKPKSDQPTYTLPDATGKALVIDTSKDKTNLSGLKLTYTPKTGMFKGSFKVYALQSGKLKKFTVNATGAVVDGVGYGIARCKKPAVAWSVTVK